MNISLISAFKSSLIYELKLSFRNPSAILNPLLFLLMVCTLFPFGVGAESSTLAKIAPGVIWVAALLSTLLALDQLFKPDFEDGSVEQWGLSPHSTSVLALSKVTAHWILTGVPLILVSPILGYLMNLPTQAFAVLAASLLLGTPALSLIGGIAVALTAGIQRSGLLLSLLLIPLFIPILIFGASAVQSAALGLESSGQLYILAAALVLAITLAPFAMASAIKVSLN
ncbi:MAG: heme exporter protein B [Saprospiraceae bacterium]|jgi:heme exporter protein B